MATVLVIVATVRAYEPDEVALTKDDYVFQQFPAATADPTLGHAVLPRTARCDAAGLYAHPPHNGHHL